MGDIGRILVLVIISLFVIFKKPGTGKEQATYNNNNLKKEWAAYLRMTKVERARYLDSIRIAKIEEERLLVLQEIRRKKAAQLDSIVKFHHEKYNFNGAILVAEEGKIIYENTIGYADFRRRIPIQTNSAFQLASVSKQFTAMAILILKERGFLSLDDKAVKYIPGFPYKTITIRHLLQHTSGLPEYVNGKAFDKYLPKNKLITNRNLLEIMKSKRMRLAFRPGTRHKYNNTGYAMLALIIEKTSRQPYHEFMETNIFQPLQMKNTFTYDQLKSCPDTCIVNMLKPNKNKSARLNYISGDKGIYSTVEDMFLWDQSLYTDKLVSTATIEEAFTAGKTINGKSFAYGYGWRIKESDDGKRIIMHRGLWESFNPAVIRMIDDKKTLIMLSNIIPPFSSTKLINPIMKVLMEKEPVKEIASIE